MGFTEKTGCRQYKGQVVAKGFMQVEGLDHDDTFAPVVKFMTLRTLLAMAATHDLEITQLDVKSAFLHADLNEEIYLECPAGFDGTTEDVWGLIKSLYGLKQAGR